MAHSYDFRPHRWQLQLSGRDALGRGTVWQRLAAGYPIGPEDRARHPKVRTAPSAC